MKQLLHCLGLLLTFSVATFAQVSSGTITGAVRDANDAVIAGAKVKGIAFDLEVIVVRELDQRGALFAAVHTLHPALVLHPSHGGDAHRERLGDWHRRRLPAQWARRR